MATHSSNSCLENPMDGGAWWAAVHGVTKSRTWLGNFTFTFHFHALEKEMATHSSVLAWRIPGMVEPGGLPSMGSHRVGHDWSNLAAAAAAIKIFIMLIWLYGITDSNGYDFELTLGESEWQGKPDVLQSMGSQRVGHDLATKQHQCWYEIEEINPHL